MVRAFEQVSGKKVVYRIGPRRAGDVATCYADPTRARKELGWRAEKGLMEMCRDSWNWQQRNPDGY
jgi:UDP-glucose 4-epimerase